MPRAAPRPCRKPGCAALVTGRPGLCPAHLKQQRQAIDARRGSREERGYDWTWRTRIRPEQLGRQPLCVMCAEAGQITPATVVDHIDGDSSHNDPDNLRSLCKRHHDQRTGRDQGFGRKL